MALSSVSSRRNPLLEWFPFYVHRLVGDVRYRALKDYQQAWYLNLLFASWVSERPGYLPDDGQLWRLANARTRQFFLAHPTLMFVVCSPTLKVSAALKAQLGGK